MHRLIIPLFAAILASGVRAEIVIDPTNQRQDKAIAMTMAMAAVPETPETFGIGLSQYHNNKSLSAAVTLPLPGRLDRLSVRLLTAWSGNDNAVAAGISYHY